MVVLRECGNLRFEVIDHYMYKLEILEKLKTWESENFEYVFIIDSPIALNLC